MPQPSKERGQGGPPAAEACARAAPQRMVAVTEADINRAAAQGGRGRAKAADHRAARLLVCCNKFETGGWAGGGSTLCNWPSWLWPPVHRWAPAVQVTMTLAWGRCSSTGGRVEQGLQGTLCWLQAGWGRMGDRVWGRLL